MAQIEPMDIDAIESDFDNKENAFHYNNVLSRTPCTEKGYEELDVSELNMKLRYSITPASSPMSKSFTGPCLDSRNCNSEDYKAVGAENGNLTRSFNSTFTKSESLNKSKVLPLQTLSTDPFVDSNRNSSMRRSADSIDNNVTVSVSNTIDIDENLSLPSTCSSVPDTPEATTPTKEIPKSEGSPIMRGLKSVLSMFRPSQSPILPSDDKATKLEVNSPVEFNKSKVETVQVSTPVGSNKQGDANSSKRNSPLKDSLVFNDDLERELQWKDETTIIFKEERIPVHKLFFQNPLPEIPVNQKISNNIVEHMDISCDESINKSNIKIESNEQSFQNEQPVAGESDNEFLDCENTFTKSESSVADHGKFQKDNEVQETGNVNTNLSNTVEILRDIDSENNAINNTFCVTPEDINSCTDKACMLVTPKIGGNDIDIIQATMNLLVSERNEYGKLIVNYNVDIENKLKLKTELILEDLDNVVSIDELIVKDNGLVNTTEVKSFESDNMKNEIATSNNLDDENIRESDQQISMNVSSDNISEVCRKTFNNIHNVNDISNQTLHSKEIPKIIEIDKMEVTVKDNAGNDPGFDNNAINRECVNIIDCEPNIDMPNLTNKLGSVDTGEIKSNTVVLSGDKDIILVTADNSKSVGDILNNGSKIKQDLLTARTDKGKDFIPELEDKSFAANNVEKTFNEESIITVDKPVTCTTNDKDDISIKTASVPSVTELINPTKSITVHSDMNDELNSTMGDLKSVIPEINKCNEGIIENILETKKELFPFEMSSKEYVEPKLDYKMQTFCDVVNTISVVNNTLNSDCDNIELIRTDATFLKSPSEIPLPDDDDIEQNVLESNGYKGDCNKKDITTLEICKKDCIVDVKNELIVDSTKFEQAEVAMEGISMINRINEFRTEMMVDKVPLTEEENNIPICISVNDPITVSKTISMNNENMEQDRAIIDSEMPENNILREENVSKDISISEETFKNVKQDNGNSEVSDNTENKVMKEKVFSNTEATQSVTQTGLVIAEKYSDMYILDKPADINQENFANKSQADIILEKEVDEKDEEIITSANNSPYVSVTDLDMAAEKIIEDPLREIDNPIVTNSIPAYSPPISPKIVSKGYNFNFDEIDDPFATKTKIRMSPSPDTANQSITPVTTEAETQEVPNKVNRRKSQAERKKLVQKKNMKPRFNDKLDSKESASEKRSQSTIDTLKHNVLSNISTLSAKKNMSECPPENSFTSNGQCDKMNNKEDESSKSITSSTDQVKTSDIKPGTQDEMIKNIEQTLVISTEKSTSSSEQYFSLGTSSGESSGLMNRSKNVFNLPEIDDVNFNPFATKPKMRMSPPVIEKPKCPLQDTNDSSKSFIIQRQPENNTTISNNIDITFNKTITNDSSPNKNNSTSSSKNIDDIDSTVREILTEEEDTIEGPFLEVDDLTDAEKLTDVETETDMMNFEEIPQQDRDDNLENGELFIDADAFEFLLNQNKSTTVLDSGKESLFLKFDPLFAKRVSSDGILAALSKVQKRQSTPKKLTKPTQKDFTLIEKSTAGPCNDNIESCDPIEECMEDLSSTITKPMMVVNPAVSSIVTQKKPATPKLNRRSLTFTSPAMAVIDRLLSLSGNSPHFEHDATSSQTVRDRSETDLAITQLRELLAEKEINVHSLRSESKELKDRLAALEGQVKSLEMISAERLAKINELNEKLLEKSKVNKSMAIVVEEYERTIASLIAETEQDKRRNADERMRLIKERDEQTAHLTSMEVSFSDLHSKYEKSKQIILSCKANEDIYKKSIKEFQDNFSKMQNNYELLKQHATSKLNHANQELEKMNRAHEAEVLKMNAMIKRKELHITSLEETLSQKTKANEELTAICDELINKVG